MTMPPDVTIVINGHREKNLAYPTLRALAQSISQAADQGLSVEVIAILDRPDDRTTSLFTEELADTGLVGAAAASTSIVEVDYGDLGLSRNEGVRLASADVVGTLDADNIVSVEWISRALARVLSTEHPAVVHPDHIVTFESRHTVWPLIESTDERFRIELLSQYNYWDAFSMARKSVYVNTPFARTGAELGVGPEDWHWNAETLSAGVQHLTAPKTVLFYRVKRFGSLLDAHEQQRSLLPRTPLLSSRDIAALAASRRFAPVKVEVDHEYPPSVDERARRLIASAASGSTAQTPVLREVLKEASATTDKPRRRPFRAAESDSTGEFDPAHYRTRYADLAGLNDRQAARHWDDYGKAEGRIGRLDDDELGALGPTRFNADHYRLLYGDARELTRAQAVAHYLAHGLPNGRTAILTQTQLEWIRPEVFNPDHYQMRYGDLEHFATMDAVAHYLLMGHNEGRSGRLTATELATMPRPLDPWLEQAWRVAHEIDPLIAPPSSSTLHRYRWWGGDWHQFAHPQVEVYWKVIAALPERTDAVFVAPWMRLGGGDLVLTRYMDLIRQLTPDQNVVLITTEPGASTHLSAVPSGVTVIELGEMLRDVDISPIEASRLLATVLVQVAPRMMHVINSSLGVDVIDAYQRALSTSTTIFLSTFVIERGEDGEMLSWLIHRSPELLEYVAGVLVDHHAIIDRYHELYRFDRAKFFVHHQQVNEPLAPRKALTGASDLARILWTGRFDKQKRLDILAAVSERLIARNVPAHVHFYGSAVISDERTQEHLDRLTAAGAIRNPPFTGGFSSIGPERFDIFLLTSESEGIPNVMLEAMSAGIPVVGPLVGGVGEVLDSNVGYPVSTFDAVDEYVDQIVAILTDYDEAIARASRARALMESEFSRDRFIASVRATPGYLA